MGREIITIQLGTASNFVGAHFFNIQDASFSYNKEYIPPIDNDILFHSGENNEFSPRLLVVDSRDSVSQPSDLSFKGEAPIREFNHTNLEIIHGCYPSSLAEPESTLIQPENRADISKALSYYNVEDKVTGWQDLLTTSYDRRYYHLIDSITMPPIATTHSYCNFGRAIWDEVNFNEKFVDNLRSQLEDCDNLQGFHLTFDANTCLSGMACGCLQYLNDECPKSMISSFPIYDIPGDTRDLSAYSAELTNISHSYSSCAEYSTITTPLSTLTTGPRMTNGENIAHRNIPELNYKTTLNRISSLLATAMEMVSFPYRTRDQCKTMHEFISSNTFNGRTFTTSSLYMPWVMRGHQFLSQEIADWNSSFYALLPVDIEPTQVLAQSVSAKYDGTSTQLVRDPFTNPYNSWQYDESINTLSRLFELYFDSKKTHIRTLTSDVSKKFRLPYTYPDIFNSTTGSFKPSQLSVQRQHFGPLRDMNIIGGLHNTNSMYGFLDKIVLQPKDIAKFTKLFDKHNLSKSCIEEDMETLMKLTRCYDTHPSFEL